MGGVTLLAPAAGLLGATVGELWRPFGDALGVRHDFDDALLLFTLGFARWAPVFGMTPFIGGRLVPNPIRVGLAVFMALWVLPWVSAQAPLPLGITSVGWWALLLKEVLIGFLLAFGAGLVFWAAEMGGRFIDNVRGTTTANLLIPQVSTQSSLLGDFYYQLFVVLYVLAGGHLWFLSAVFQSYEILPPTTAALALATAAESFIAATGGLFVVALKIMAPALVVLMLMDLMLGVANRMAPQLDVFFISLSLKSAVGSLVVALSLYYLLGMAPDFFRDQHRWLGETIHSLPAENGAEPSPPPAAAAADEAR
ncbi:MAG TPA: type III secretion system export apparatus subunit SctT [Thermoanaerobaculia bacterium]|nr:type III secretion system export apparatus subunit SctT [Thermoanaerobaculia bacterium]